MQDREIEQIEGLDPPMTHDVIRNLPNDPPPPLLVDITFQETRGGYEIFYSERLANEYRDLVDQSADWLEGEMGVLNLGQIDHSWLIADGRLTDMVRNGLIAWWRERVEDLDMG